VSETVLVVALVVAPLSLVAIVAIVFGHRFRGSADSEGVRFETRPPKKK